MMGKVCEGCGQTRWEGRQVDGWITSMREEIETLKDERDRAVDENRQLRAALAAGAVIHDGSCRAPDGDPCICMPRRA